MPPPRSQHHAHARSIALEATLAATITEISAQGRARPLAEAPPLVLRLASRLSRQVRGLVGPDAARGLLRFAPGTAYGEVSAGLVQAQAVLARFAKDNGFDKPYKGQSPALQALRAKVARRLDFINAEYDRLRAQREAEGLE